MPRRAPGLECTAETRAELIAIGRSRIEEVRMVERARIVLACLDGKEIQQVALEVGASIPTVSKWRKRFAKEGIAGLRDQPRSGKPPIYGAAFRDRVLATLEQSPPGGLASGMDRPLPGSWEQACMLYGGCCVAKGYICNVCELGA